jgi:hypothetical protein
MNYVFVNTKAGKYPVLYRHDVYGDSNPRLIGCLTWMVKFNRVMKGEVNLSLTIL